MENKKVLMKRLTPENSFFPFLLNKDISFSKNFSNVLWNKKQKEIIRIIDDKLCTDMLSDPIKKKIGLAENGRITDTVRVKLNRFIAHEPNYLPYILKICVAKIFSQWENGKEKENWETILMMQELLSLLGDERLSTMFPEERISEAIEKNWPIEKLFVDDRVYPFMELLWRYFFIREILFPSILSALKKIKDRSLETKLEKIGDASELLADFKEFQKIRHDLAKARRGIQSCFSKVCLEGCDIFITSLSYPEVFKAVQTFLDNEAEIKNELVQILGTMLAPKFDPEDLRLILEQIEPPFSVQDKKIVELEIDALENCQLTPETSQFFLNILPAIRGEKVFDGDSFRTLEDTKEDNLYSSKLLRNLEKNIYSLKTSKNAAETVKTQNAEDSGQEKDFESVRIIDRTDRENIRRVWQEERSDSSTNDDNFVLSNISDKLDVPTQYLDLEDVLDGDQPLLHEKKELEVVSREYEDYSSIVGAENKEDQSEEDPQVAGFNNKRLSSEFIEPPVVIVKEMVPAPKEVAIQEIDLFATEPTEKEITNAIPEDFLPCSFSQMKKNVEHLDPRKILKILLQTSLSKAPVSADKILCADAFRKGLENHDFASLYWLAKAMGEDTPTPAWLYELLVLGTRFHPAFTDIFSRLEKLFTTAMQKFDELNEKDYPLLAAALLRPALLMPRSGMATLASSLSNRLSIHKLTPFFKELSRFIQHGKPLDSALITGQSPHELFKMRTKELEKKTRNFLERMRNLKIPYAVASHVRKNLFGEKGEPGLVLVQCLSKITEPAEIFVRKYENSKEIENLIDGQSTKRIEAKARQRLMGDIKEAVSLAANWVELVKNENQIANTPFAEQAFAQLLASLPQDMDSLRYSLEGSILSVSLDKLKARNREVSEDDALSPAVALNLRWLRIPFFQKEVSPSASIIVAESILDGSMGDEKKIAGSLGWHMAKGYLDECSEYLEKYLRFKTIIPDFSVFKLGIESQSSFSLEEYLSAATTLWKENFAEALTKARNTIIDYEFRGAINTSQQVSFTSKVANIEKKYGQGNAWAEGCDELKKIMDTLGRYQGEQKKQLEEKISEIEQNEGNFGQARYRLEKAKESLEKGEFNITWDTLANIMEHLGEDDLFLSDYENPQNLVDDVRIFYEEFLSSTRHNEITGNAHWEKAKSLLRNKNFKQGIDPRSMGIITEMIRYLGFSLAQDKQPKVISSLSQGSPNFWRALQFEMEINGPLPQWSSVKHRHTVVFGWNVKPEHVQQLLSHTDMSNDDCKTIICFNPLTKEDRIKILAFCAAKKPSPVAPLIIDENLHQFLEQEKPESRVNLMFRICLAGTKIIPYVDVAGAVPKEMFFGRHEAIRSIVEPFGACIIYGGRQLGKSALLHQLYSDKKDGITVLHHSFNSAETSLLEAIRRKCVDAKIIDPNTTLKTLSVNIGKWLDFNKTERILMLFDECDNVLDVDQKNGFKEIAELRSLMESTERRFKVVITGLHSVQRFSQIANQPFLHFGEPLCIGPLPPHDAKELMMIPMSILGLTFESEQLVQQALSYCSYQPKSIQVFCKELLKALVKKPSRPLQNIDRKTILEIYRSQNLKEVIRNCFTMTLDMDKRYRIIGYVLAYHDQENMKPSDLLEELRYFWPAAFTGPNMRIVLESLLHEMKGLGLVTMLDNHYRLRTPKVVELLGGMEEIEEELCKYKDEPYNPVGNPDAMRLEGAPMFVASQYNLLIEKSPLFCWVIGSSALGIEDVPNALKRIAQEQGFEFRTLAAADENQMMRELRKVYDEVQKGGILCCLDVSQFPYLEAFTQKALKWLESLHTNRKFMKIICVVDPQNIYSLIFSRSAEQYASHLMPLMPWSKDGFENWRNEKSRSDILPHDVLDILKKSSGWHKSLLKVLGGGKTVDTLSVRDILGGDYGRLLPIIKLLKAVGPLKNTDLEGQAKALVELQGKLVTLTDINIMYATLETLRMLSVLREEGDMLEVEPMLSELVETAGDNA